MSDDTNSDSGVDIEAARRAILDASLPHVPFDGWTVTAIAAGARDAGFEPSMAVRAFPGGPRETIEYWNAVADQELLDALAKRAVDNMRVRDRVALAVRLRIESQAAHREAVRRGLAYLALPGNAALGLRCLHRTVDTIWHAAGDRSTDYNWYTKRGLLAGVYASTVTVWVNDTSEDFADTWSFLDRRIDEVVRVAGGIGRTVKRLGDFDPSSLFRRVTPDR